MITMHSQSLPDQGKPVTLDCPSCSGEGVQSECFQSIDRVKLVYLIPLAKLRNTYVVCGECGGKIRTRTPMSEIEGKGGEELTELLRLGEVGGGNRLAVRALKLSWIPFIGLILVAHAMIKSGGDTKGWARVLNLLSLVIAIITAFIGLTFLLTR